MYITKQINKKASSLSLSLKGLKKPSKSDKSLAFTITELLIAIAIIGILSTVGIVSFANIRSSTRDTQRSSKITIIAEALEKYYSQHGEYPSCNAMSQPISTVVANTLVGVDPTNLTTPSSTSGTNSFAAPTTVSCDPAIINNLSSDVFAYVGNNSTPCLTTSGQTAACLQYTLKYREESTGNTISLTSRHTIPTLATPAAPNTTVTLSGSNVLATITPVSCPAGSITQYGIKNRTNTGSWSGYTTWDTITTATQTANQGVKYEYQSEARCYPDGSATSASTAAVGSISNVYINPITTVPTVPAVVANTSGSTTTWSWTASTGCASGTSVGYRYDYTTSYGYDSGWVATAGTSVGFTTSAEGQTYTLAVQAQCYNANTSSSWSASGSANYYRPVSTYTLTTTAGTGGTVSSGGTYNVGSTPTITATPNASYSFSSWSGSTGCSGTASHTITMDANKTCTANFTPTAIAAPAAPTVTTSTPGSTTTWSWNAASCPGNTARYQYDYTTSYGYDSGWAATAGTSVSFDTSNAGYTYTVTVQAQCYNGVTSSVWSVSGSDSYYRPITTYTLTTTANTGGTVSSGGTYNVGSTPTITATPTANYSFSSWSGSTGCSGTASHTITMDASKTCTANFTLNTYILTTTAGTGGTVSTGGTYNAGSTPTITATPNASYSFSSWSGSTGCSGTASHTITMDASKTCTANFTPTAIAAPSAPTVAASTSGSTTTWSWSTLCPGNSIRYQYRYTITPSGYDSGLVATAGTSVAFTTATEGQTYTVTVQAQCYNAVTSISSPWSGPGSANYTRPYTPPTLTLSASPSSITTGQSTTLTLTSNKDVSPTPYYLKIYDQTTGTYLASTGGGATLSYTDTPATTQTYVARATDSTGATVYSSSSAVTVSVSVASYTLTTIANTGGTVSAGGTYNSGTVRTITATPINALYVFSSWSGSTGCSGVVSHTITMDANKTCTANFTLNSNWYVGVGGLTGKYVYKMDLSRDYYKTDKSDVISPQGAIGLDPNYPSSMSLVSPQVNPAVDFSHYPAQNDCKAIGGRLPNMQELLAIYTDRVIYYGNNFHEADSYWSSTEYSTDNARILYFYEGAPSYYSKIVNGGFYFRCVAG